MEKAGTRKPCPDRTKSAGEKMLISPRVFYAPEQPLKLEASLGGWGGAEGSSKSDPIEKLFAVGTYPGQGAQNPLTVNNAMNDWQSEGPEPCSLGAPTPP